MITLTVVVPATDSPPTLARCRNAIAAADAGPEQLVVVAEPADLSASGARNAGAARATGDVVVFVDADVEVHPDAFARIREAFERDPGLTAVFGSYDDRPSAPGLVSAFRNLLHHHVHHSGAGPAETFWSGLGAVRRSAFVAAGGFDEARFPHPSIEDIELGGRLRAVGGRLWLDPRIQGTHLKRWTLGSMVWTDLARRGAPWVALQLRQRRLSAALNCGWRHRLSAAGVGAAGIGLLGGVPAAPVAALGLLVALNHGFYGLLARRLGPLRAVGGVLLHGLFHLVSIAAVPAGVATALVAAGRGARAPQPRVPPAFARAAANHLGAQPHGDTARAQRAAQGRSWVPALAEVAPEPIGPPR